MGRVVLHHVIITFGKVAYIADDMLSMVFVGSCCGEYRLEITWRTCF